MIKDKWHFSDRFYDGSDPLKWLLNEQRQWTSWTKVMVLMTD